MPEHSIARLIRELGSREPEHAWSEFLRAYASLIDQVVRLFERDQDHVSDCFLFVCQALSRQQFRRLRKFRPDGPAKFETWLRAVVRNLCMDWHRKECGRQRPFRSIIRLRPVDQELFRFVYEQGFSPEYALASLAPKFPDLNRQSLTECLDRISAALTPRQRWLLKVRSYRRETPLPADAEELRTMLMDPAPSPEAQWAAQENQAALQAALRKLAAHDRLVVRLRFEDGLTLDQVARVLQLTDAQSADRRIRQVLERLRELMK